MNFKDIVNPLFVDEARAEIAKLREERDRAVDLAFSAQEDIAYQIQTVEKLKAEAEKLRKERDEARAEVPPLKTSVAFAAPLRPCTARPPLPEVFEGLETIEAILAAPQRSVDPLVDASVRLSRIGAIAGRLIAITRP